MPLDPCRLFFQSAQPELPSPATRPQPSSVVTAPLAPTPTCFFMPVRVMWNFSGKVIKASVAQLSAERRVGWRPRAPNEASERT